MPTGIAIPSGPDEALVRVERAIDYLIVTADEAGGRGEHGVRPAGWDDPFDLGRGIQLRRLTDDDGDWEELLNACEAQGIDFRPARQHGPVHAYVRAVPLDDMIAGLYTWDRAQELTAAMVLSRLVRDNATSTRYALRRIIRTDGTSTYVPVSGRVAYRADVTTRAWLNDDEASQLRSLLGAYHKVESALPPRVKTAMRSVEDAAHERWMEDVLAMTVRTLEGLTATSRRSLSRRFAHRVPQLAETVGVEVSRTACRRAYADRSLTYHGLEIAHADDESQDRFRARTAQLQAVSRAAVRQAIENEELRTVLDNDAAIDAAWPVRDSVARLGWRRRVSTGLWTLDYTRDVNERRRVDADFNMGDRADVRHARLRAGLTVRDVARAAGCSLLAVEVVERRDQLDPAVEHRIRDAVQSIARGDDRST